MKKIFINRITRRQFIKTSLSSLTLTALPVISFGQSNPDVVVIGAGASGLSATAKLIKEGKSVICIEAMNRVGGRCYTDNSIFGVPYDMGAHWLHDYSINQLIKYGKNFKGEFKIYKDQAKTKVYVGKKKNDGKQLWNLYEKIKKIKKRVSSMDVPLIDYIPEEIQNHSWYDTVQKQISTADFNNYTPFDGWNNYKIWGEGDGFVEEGYGTLLAHYRKSVPVQLNTIANEIKWDGKGVKVVTNKGTISAKTCIITVSQGVLAADKIKFTPKLPDQNYAAFENIYMNNYLRVALQLDKKFYKKFGFKKDEYLITKVDNQKSISPKTFNGVMKVCGTNLSWFHAKGQFAKDLDKAGNKSVLDLIINRMKSTFGSNFEEKYLIKSHVTDWISNPYTLGTWSGATPGKAFYRDILKKSVGDRIFFAGEATSDSYGTVHGADRRGLKVASDVRFLIK
jgi:monoamine oxidase